MAEGSRELCARILVSGKLWASQCYMTFVAGLFRRDSIKFQVAARIGSSKADIRCVSLLLVEDASAKAVTVSDVTEVESMRRKRGETNDSFQKRDTPRGMQQHRAEANSGTMQRVARCHRAASCVILVHPDLQPLQDPVTTTHWQPSKRTEERGQPVLRTSRIQLPRAPPKAKRQSTQAGKP